jgi:trans-aconitate methyltransferase
VIDLGCNRGDIAFSISKKAKRVIGIDFDQTHIHAAMKNYTAPNLEFYCMDAAKYLAERSEKFDVLILSHILEHLDNPAQFVESFKNKFSYIYIEVPDFEKNYLNLYRQNLGISLIYSDNDHVFEFDRDEIAQLIAGANLEIISSEFRYGVQKYWCKVR